jgi:hypothetical protein
MIRCTASVTGLVPHCPGNNHVGDVMRNPIRKAMAIKVIIGLSLRTFRLSNASRVSMRSNRHMTQTPGDRHRCFSVTSRCCCTKAFEGDASGSSIEVIRVLAFKRSDSDSGLDAVRQREWRRGVVWYSLHDDTTRESPAEMPTF